MANILTNICNFSAISQCFSLFIKKQDIFRVFPDDNLHSLISRFPSSCGNHVCYKKRIAYICCRPYTWKLITKVLSFIQWIPSGIHNEHLLEEHVMRVHMLMFFLLFSKHTMDKNIWNVLYYIYFLKVGYIPI